jgi:UPF0755 protein
VKPLAWVAAVVGLAVLVAATAAGVVYQRVHRPYKGFVDAEQFVLVPPGAGTRTIGTLLVAAGVIPDGLTYRAALWTSGSARRLKAGEYRFDRAMTPLEVLEKMARGDVYVVSVTFPEGLTVAEMAKVFEMHGIGSAASFVAAARNPGAIASLDPRARDLEGYLFPDTYALSRHADAEQLVALMVDRFKRELTPEIRRASDGRGLGVRELVTLASIVEKETGRGDERPVVAAVYSNRLKIGMGLQCDPTLIYGLQAAGRYDGNIHREDLQFDSPYNTYRYRGLPPGPIAAPGRDSLRAAVNPADVDYLYFVSRNDGTHAFARSLDEHNRNVQKFQVQYFRAQRQKATAGTRTRR